MNVVIGIFEEKESLKTAVIRLKEAGFAEDDLALITTYQADEIREALGEEPEQTATAGAVIGSTIGGAAGLLGGLALVSVVGVGLVVAYGFLGTISGGTLGGYLGAIYATRLEDQTEHELKTALSTDKLLLFVEVTDITAEEARVIMRQAGGSYLESHEIDPAAVAGLA